MNTELNLDYRICYAGRKQNVKGRVVEFPWEKGWKKNVEEIWYIFHGEGRMRSQGGEWRSLRPGMMVWYRAGVFYEWEQDPEKPFGVHFFHFEPRGEASASVYPDPFPDTLEAMDPSFVESLSRRIIELYWEEYFEKVVKGGANPGSRNVPSPHFENESEPVRKDLFLPPTMSIQVPPRNSSALLSLAHSLFCGLVGEYLHLAEKRLTVDEVGVQRFHRRVIGDLVAQIQSDLANVPSVTDMAGQCGYGIDHFGRIFRKVMGCSAQEFVIRARIARARQLLLETGLSVKEIAADLGYASPFFFSRQFKSIVGESPTLFRQRHESA